MTLDGSDDDKIQPQGLAIPMVVLPQGVDLTTDSNHDFNNLTADEIDIQSDWDDKVNDDIKEQQYDEETAYEENDVIIEANDVIIEADDVWWVEADNDITCEKP